MTPEIIIAQAQADGVFMTLSPAGTIKASGAGEAVNRWLPTIRERKAELLAMLKAASDAAAIVRHEATDPEEREVVTWMESILENDPAAYREVLEKMRSNPTYRAAFLKMARGGAEGSA